jgi:hypothetical protein
MMAPPVAADYSMTLPPVNFGFTSCQPVIGVSVTAWRPGRRLPPLMVRAGGRCRGRADAE